MKVTSVAVNIRYAKEIEGSWKTVEVGVEASIEQGEQWTVCQQGLFAQLSAQLREVWGWGKKNGQTPEHARNGSESHGEPSWEELKEALTCSSGKLIPTQGPLLPAASDGVS
jgi:hypothetical protein